MTSNDRSGRTRTTIMWIELVPMSMAAMRMWVSAASAIIVAFGGPFYHACFNPT